jgi:hypothetical protein
MRAKFVNEKFTQDSDPIKDMNIGYSKRVLNSKTWKVLEFIKNKGKEGASLTEIQYFIWTKLNKHDPNEFWEKMEVGWYPKKYLRKTRGYWNTQLYGAYNSYREYGGHRGILNKYCEKNNKGKWVFKRYPNPKEKLYSE